MREALLSPGDLERLAALTLGARRRHLGSDPGGRQTARRGLGLEFASHRAYVEGDDLRHLDWALYGRLGKPFVKTYEEERDLPVHLLLDTSRSMAFGDPPKLEAACRLAAALGYIALASQDRVGCVLFDGRGLRPKEAGRGRGAYHRLQRFLASAKADGPYSACDALRLHAAAARPGLTVILSDFLEPDVVESLRPHCHRRHSLVWIQLLAPEERDPVLDGDLELTDAETEHRVEVSLGNRERAAYRDRLAAHQDALQAMARRHGAEFFSLSSEQSLEEMLRRHLLRGSFLRSR